MTSAPSTACRAVEAEHDADAGSGSRRGPTVSETHSESSAQMMISARRLVALVLPVSEGINEVMSHPAKGMYGLRETGTKNERVGD